MTRSHSHSVYRPSLPEPPGAWSPARNFARLALAPVERFLKIEASSGILLLIATGIALLCANSPLSALYQSLWHTEVGFRIGSFRLERDLHFLINDGLMTIFFFVVGLEIRRELAHGELSELRRAALPLAAALGGMLVPAAIFLLLNLGGPGQHGWGVPMATDIAFAVGVLALLGKRVPNALRILLLALAVIDDVGAILVIAIFYSAGLSLSGLLVAAAGIGLILAFQLLGVRSPFAYVLPALITWTGVYMGGVHPTLTGVIVGLMTPVRAWYGTEKFLEATSSNVDRIRAKEAPIEPEILPHLAALTQARKEAVSPTERLLFALHGWVSYAIMPVFALANAGVPLGSARLEGAALTVFAGVTLGLALGKPVGVLLLSWLSCRTGIAALPQGVRWTNLSVVGTVAGIGFTMALFVAQLAFEPGPLLETAKLGVLAGSGASALIAFVVGRWVLSGTADAAANTTSAEAEQSTAR